VPLISIKKLHFQSVMADCHEIAARLVLVYVGDTEENFEKSFDAVDLSFNELKKNWKIDYFDTVYELKYYYRTQLFHLIKDKCKI